ncbi:MAG TPA: pantetheine-phosphate adenylyltransferase [Bacteroidetes bacterium]|nr:phosphopantetheine adenylyltransferase [bacterium BMS3Bbin04]HDO66114.1 pantetheine-phosphate adenylyltransferase [Bacteroidota bacterium]HEX05239.1 pantetheine-phosphate adenylyltransferase [Bacteroidota bacterium]
MNQPRTAVYPGTFDPVTNGHLDILERGCDLFDRIVICISSNPAKAPMFSADERLTMIETAIASNGLQATVEVKIFDGLIVDYAEKLGAIALLRGLRAVSDFEFEFQMALMNRHLNNRLHTVYLMPKDEYTYLSSSIIKNVATYGGDIHRFVPANVEKRLKEKFSKTEGE